MILFLSVLAIAILVAAMRIARWLGLGGRR